MKSIAALVICCFLSTPAFAQQCGKAEMPSPNGCIRVCPPGDYHIGKDARASKPASATAMQQSGFVTRSTRSCH